MTKVQVTDGYKDGCGAGTPAFEPVSRVSS